MWKSQVINIRKKKHKKLGEKKERRGEDVDVQASVIPVMIAKLWAVTLKLGEWL